MIKYSHLSSHPSSHLKMPTKIEINKILTPSNFDFYKKLTPDLEFCAMKYSYQAVCRNELSIAKEMLI